MQATPQLLVHVAAPQPSLQSSTQSLPQTRPHVDMHPPTHRALFNASSMTCRISSRCLALSLVDKAAIFSLQGKVLLPL
jgi:hypothetical protein